jgi:SNF2 family DNA or RNA helicase
MSMFPELDKFTADELKTTSELEASIEVEKKGIKELNVEIDIYNEKELMFATEQVPYKQKIDEITKQITALQEQRALLRNQAYEIGQYMEAEKNKKVEAKNKKERKKRYIDKLKDLLNKKKTQEERDQKIRERGEELQAKASEFHWYSKIKPYQLEAAKQAAVMGRAILGDEMGLGKSLTSLAAADLVGAKKLLIISKRDIINNFAKEVRVWAPHRPESNIFCSLDWKKGHVKQHIKTVLPLFPEFTVLLNFETLWNDEDLLADLINLQFDAIIIDEAHHMKEDKKNNFINIKKLCFAANKCSDCGYRKVQMDNTNPGVSIDWICTSCGHTQSIEDARSIKLVLLTREKSGRFCIS